MSDIILPDELLEMFDEMDRNARAYGYEVGLRVGRGEGWDVNEDLEASFSNPFMEPDWRGISESNLVKHARKELELIGEDPELIDMYLEVVEAFESFGHSGGSASVAIPVINNLLQFKNLSPLTDDPNEWMDVSEMSGCELWQSRRNPEAFSEDGGKTFYILSENDSRGGRKIQTSKPKGG